MPLFESKPKLSIEDCCRQFYDSNIFQAIIHGIDGWSILLDTYFKSIAEVDQSFLSVDPTLFRNEMTALRMELFALAWSERFKERDKYTFPQSSFTRTYLEENGSLDIWGIMGAYNQAIAMSATMNAYGKPTPGGIGRAQVTFINGMRVNVAKNMYKTYIGDKAMTKEDEDHQIECVNHVVNFIGAGIKREDSVVVKLLCSRLANRLGCDVNLKSEALFRLAAFIFGFYKGVEEYLKSVDLQAKELS